MTRSDTLNRRDFTRLTGAALGGLVAGSLVGCGGDDEGATGGPDNGGGENGGGGEAEHNAQLLLEEPHVCRGLNACMDKAKGGDNACAGQSACATAEAHGCHGQNECKGQGGCGEYPGQNTCSGKGECAVPLSDKAWTNARAKLEELLEAEGKKLAEAPPKAS